MVHASYLHCVRSYFFIHLNYWRSKVHARYTNYISREQFFILLTVNSQKKKKNMFFLPLFWIRFWYNLFLMTWFSSPNCYLHLCLSLRPISIQKNVLPEIPNFSPDSGSGSQSVSYCFNVCLFFLPVMILYPVGRCVLFY